MAFHCIQTLCVLCMRREHRWRKMNRQCQLHSMQNNSPYGNIMLRTLEQVIRPSVILLCDWKKNAEAEADKNWIKKKRTKRFDSWHSWIEFAHFKGMNDTTIRYLILAIRLSSSDGNFVLNRRFYVFICVCVSVKWAKATRMNENTFNIPDEASILRNRLESTREWTCVCVRFAGT